MTTSDVHVRHAKEDDMRMLWEWANDPLVRASAYSTDPIPWEDHIQWLTKKLSDPETVIYIAEADEPIGQVRFDLRDDGSAEIDVHLAPTMRGKGLGTAMLISAIERYFSETDTPLLHSEAKVENEASRKLFQKAGFSEAGIATVHGQDVYQFTLKRS